MPNDAPFNLDSFLPYQLAVVAERLGKEFSQIYKSEFGLSRSEWRVIAHLSRDTAVSVREIATEANLDKSKVSRAVTKLEAEGYIRKEPSQSDRRLVVLSLTDEGRKVLQAITPLARSFETDICDRIGPSADQFRKVLEKIQKT